MMKCPLCKSEMQPGLVKGPDFHLLDANDFHRFIEGPRSRHCIFTPLDEESQEELVVVPNNNPRPAYCCSKCEVTLIWGPNWSRCPHCRTPINLTNGIGVTSPEEEPWLIVCEECHTSIEPDL